MHRDETAGASRDTGLVGPVARPRRYRGRVAPGIGCRRHDCTDRGEVATGWRSPGLRDAADAVAGHRTRSGVARRAAAFRAALNSCLGIEYLSS